MGRKQDEMQAHRGHEVMQRVVEANRRKFDNPDPSPGIAEQRQQQTEAALAAAKAELEACRHMLRAYETSTSWRLTRPLRWAGNALQTLRPGLPAAAEQPGPPARPRPLRYEEWIAGEEATSRIALVEPGPGHQAMRPVRLGLVLLDGAVPPDDPSGCSILRLHHPEAACSALAEQAHVVRRAVAPGLPPSEAVRLALELLDAELIGFIAGSERLARDALALAANVVAQYPAVDLLFADEDWLDADGRRERPFFKPGWSAELQRGCDLVGPFAFYRTELVRKATISAGPAWRYDLANQVAAASRPERIRHIPAVLCHRSALPPGHAEAMGEAAAAQLARDRVAAQVEPVPGRAGWLRTRYAVPSPEPLVSVIVPTRDRADLLRVCADGVLNRTEYPALELLLVDNGTTDPDAAALLDELAGLDRVRVLRRPGAFNWSALNNAAAAEARGTILLLLNNDVTVLRPDWLAVLAALAVQPGVGAVGSKLLYPDGRVQHAGLTTDQAGIPRHLFRFAGAAAEADAAADASGSLALLGLARDVWGLTGACLAIPRNAFEAVGGLNEALPVAYNDVDLCLRLTAQGYRLVWTPWSVVEHRELTSRPPDHLGPRRVQAQEERNRLLRDWGALALHDPFLNPNLRLVDERPCLGRVTAPLPLGQPAAAPLVPLAREDEVSATQARRDRSRLIGAIAALQACRGVSARRAVGRVLDPVRAAAQAVRAAPGGPCGAASSHDALPVRAGGERGLALVIDDHWPQPDRDAGSVEIVNLVQALGRLGFETILAAAKQHNGVQPSRERLQASGQRCLQPADAASVEQFIERRGLAIDLVVLCRVFCGGAFLEAVQQHCLGARLVFNAIDLNFLREERKAGVLGDAALRAMLQQVRAREEHVIRQCDATMVVSAAEVELLGQTVPESFAVQMPLARHVRPPATPFAARRGIGFIGSFAHAPNVDAVRFLLTEIWPLIARDLPDCELAVVGADAPPGLLDGLPEGGGERVRLLGHVPDVEPWFESLRLTVAPLRFGAGAKGKVASSLAAGVPCIATPMAAEGMALAEAAGVLVEAEPAAFAAATVRAYRDPALWGRLSAGGLAYAESVLSPDEWQARLDRLLRRIGL